jgi:hypothetical protein
VLVGGTTSTGAVQTVSPGTSGYLLTSGGASAVPTWAAAAAGATATYATTLADVSNSTTETTVLSFVIPAAAMSTGDIIDVTCAALYKNNKGSSGTITFNINVGAGAQVNVNAGVVNATDDSTEYQTTVMVRLMRVGSVVWVLARGGGYSFSGNPFGSNNAVFGTSTPTNFTSTNTVSLKVTLNAANALFYYKASTASGGAGMAVHTKN